MMRVRVQDDTSAEIGDEDIIALAYAACVRRADVAEPETVNRQS